VPQPSTLPRVIYRRDGPTEKTPFNLILMDTSVYHPAMGSCQESTSTETCLPTRSLAHITLLPPSGCSSRTTYRHTAFSSSESCTWFHLHVTWFFCNDFSPTPTTAPFLRCQSFLVFHHHPVFSFMVGHNCPEWPALPYYRLLLSVHLLFLFRKGLTPPQCPLPYIS
jgi:hypothetical protein